MPNRLYIGIIDYYATGEGRHLWLAFCSGTNEQEAKVSFLKRFPDIPEYYQSGLIITDNIEDENLLEWQDIVKEPYNWLKDKVECGPVFKLEFNMNCS